MNQLNIGRVCVWGFTRPSDHTHHWIHDAFYNAFAELSKQLETNIEVCWYDSESPPLRLTKRSTLFLTACDYSGNRGNADIGIPINELDWYCVHQGWSARASKYSDAVARGRCIFFEEYRISKDWIATPFIRVQANKNTIIFPWATDLMPWSIIEQLADVTMIEKKRRGDVTAVYVGSVWEQNFQEFIQLLIACSKRQLRLQQRGAFVKSELLSANEHFQQYANHGVIDKRPVTRVEHATLIRSARIAPAVQGTDQIGTYIADRILKNISYGTLGITNNPLVVQLLGDCVVFSPDINEMVEIADGLSSKRWIEMTREGMLKVASSHTYLQRIRSMLDMLANKQLGI